MNDEMVGQTFAVRYPFVRCDATALDCEGRPYEFKSWKPGTAYKKAGTIGQQDGDHDSFADGIGTMELTVVSTHKPPEFPTRVFYLRKFVTPDGHRFGKHHLHVTTLGNFRRMCRGFRHGFDVVPS